MKEKIKNSQRNLRLISENENEIYVKAKFGPSKETRIPLSMDENLSFFIASIIGDGHLRKEKFQISIELTEKKLLIYLKNICKKLFCREFNINKVKLREGRRQTYNMVMDSKAIYSLLNEVFGIPSGRKSHLVKIPEYIKNSDEKAKLSFLRGIMATEGGKRRRGYGLSTASENLWKDLISLFEELKIPILIDKWEHKKYRKIYYGLVFKKEYMPKLMWVCRSGQTGDV